MAAPEVAFQPGGWYRPYPRARAGWPARSRIRSAHWIGLSLALAVVAGTLAAGTYRHVGATWDEPEHLAAGLQLLDRGAYTYDVQHPPLGRLAIALGPYLGGARSHGEPGPSGVREGQDILYQAGDRERLLVLARLGTLPFLFVLLGATWLWAQRIFGGAEATLAVLMLATCPPLLGQAALATLDVPGAASCTLACYCLLRWTETRSHRHALWAGLAAGLAVATKLSGLPFLVLTAAAWLLSGAIAAHGTARVAALARARAWPGATLIAATALVATVLSYGPQLIQPTGPAQTHGPALAWLAASHPALHHGLLALASMVPVPVGVVELPYSIQVLVWHNTSGHLSYLLGHVSQAGWRGFYLVALGVKTPLPFLLLALAGLAILGWHARPAAPAAHGARQPWQQSAIAVGFVALLGFCSFYSHINIGVRHVFVLYPLMAMAAGAAAMRLWRQWPQPAARMLLAALLCWQLATPWAAFPDYLAYFNPLAGHHPERILVDSDLDWGQDLARLATRLRELHVKQFSFIYQGSADLAREGLPTVRQLPAHTPAVGWVAASLYARRVTADGSAYAWLDRFQPRERIGKTIDLYFIPPAGSAAQSSTTGPPAACVHAACPGPLVP